MKTEFSLFEHSARERFLGTRYRALALREDLEKLLNTNGEVVVDFKDVEATQSFIDELLGVLVLERGPDLINRIAFRSCSENVKAIINFVVGDRIAQYHEMHQPSLPH